MFSMGAQFELCRVILSICFAFIRWIRGQSPDSGLVKTSGH